MNFRCGNDGFTAVIRNAHDPFHREQHFPLFFGIADKVQDVIFFIRSFLKNLQRTGRY
jgi:hypothetical protein